MGRLGNCEANGRCYSSWFGLDTSVLVILFFPTLLCTGHMRLRCRRMREMHAEERRSVHDRERRGQWILRAGGA